MRPTTIHIETGYNDNGDYCLFANMPKHEYMMPITLDNLDEVVGMLNNAIVDILSEERIMLANSKTTEE